MSQGSKAPGSSDRPSRGGAGLLEHEIDELKEKNARLERRLEEAEMSAELQASANRILSLPLPKDA